MLDKACKFCQIIGGEEKHNYHDITSKSLMEGKQANPSDEELTRAVNLIINHN